MKHLIVTLVMLATLTVVRGGEAIEFKARGLGYFPETKWDSTVPFSTVTIYIAFPLVFICTYNCKPQYNEQFDDLILPQNTLPICKSGTFDTRVYLGYFVVSQPPEQKIPSLTWHPAPEFSDPVYQGPVFKSVINNMAMLPRRMADSAVLKNWGNEKLSAARHSWWYIFWEALPERSVLVGKPDTPPDPTWRPHFEKSFKTSCAEIRNSAPDGHVVIGKFITSRKLENPLPGMWTSRDIFPSWETFRPSRGETP